MRDSFRPSTHNAVCAKQLSIVGIFCLLIGVVSDFSLVRPSGFYALERFRVHASTLHIRRCCSLYESPYVVRSPEGFDGLGIKYVRDLEDALNFKCASLAEYEPENEQFRGFTGLTRYFEDCANGGDSSGCNCDVAVSGFANTADRVSRVDFPAPYAFDSFSAVEHKDGIKNSRSGRAPLFFAPFGIG